MGQRRQAIPYADELNGDVDRERAFKSIGLLPTDIVCASIHLIRKGNLLVIGWRKEADLRDEEIVSAGNV